MSSGGHCNDDSVLVLGDSSSLSYCNGPSLDFNTLSTLHVHMLVLVVLAYHVEISCSNLMMICLLCLVAMIKMYLFPRVVVLTM